MVNFNAINDYYKNSCKHWILPFQETFRLFAQYLAPLALFNRSLEFVHASTYPGRSNVIFSMWSYGQKKFLQIQNTKSNSKSFIDNNSANKNYLKQTFLIFKRFTQISNGLYPFSWWYLSVITYYNRQILNYSSSYVIGWHKKIKSVLILLSVYFAVWSQHQCRLG